MSKINIIGAGAWGTALAIQAVRSGHDVVLVARDSAKVRAINSQRENSRLPGVVLPPNLAVDDIISADAELLLWAVPTQFVRTSLLQFRPPKIPMIVCAKGVEAETHALPLEIAAEICVGQKLGLLTGPNFALEVANGLPCAAVVASIDADLREHVLHMLGSNNFRLYGNDDPVGAQLGGAAKNVIAIAAGAVIGAGLGENARAALVTRGLAELCRLAVALGGKTETVMGLSGLGDLLLTCTGYSSRNFSLGFALGKGQSLTSILAGRSAITEGVSTAAALVARAGPVELPICQAVADLLSGKRTLADAISQLLSRPQRDE